jgi:hypothetical protein
VTAAHEFHHAVQFAYDAFEDGWIMEASSTWIEDEVYDAVNDNRQYLVESPLSQPHVPLDRNTPMEWYGAWIFLRFLSEYVGMNDGPPLEPDPSVVRAIWRRLDGAKGGTDLYSTQGVAAVIASRTLDGAAGRIRRVFADFVAWNAVPVSFYDEGGGYPPAAIAEARTLTGSAPRFASTFRIDHLAARLASLRRGTGLAKTARLKVVIDGPNAVTSPEARLVVVKTSGAVAIRPLTLDDAGDGRLKVRFGSDVRRVIVIAANGSVRYTKCWTGHTVYACYGGRPVDDDERFDVRASVI